MRRRIGLFIGGERIREKGDDVSFGVRRLHEEIQDRECGGIQNVGVPRQWIEDEASVFKVPDLKPF